MLHLGIKQKKKKKQTRNNGYGQNKERIMKQAYNQPDAMNFGIEIGTDT